MTTTRRDVLRIGAGTTLGALVAGYAPRALAADNVCPPREGAVLYVYDHEQPESRKSITPQDLVGKKAPPFHQRDVNLRSKSAKRFVGPQDYEGKVVVLNFWATWCDPCWKEFPELDKVYTRHKNDLVVLAAESPTSALKQLSSGSRYGTYTKHSGTYPLLSKEGKAPFDFRVCVIRADKELREDYIRSLLPSEIQGVNISRLPLPERFNDADLEEYKKKNRQKLQDFAKSDIHDNMGSWIGMELYGMRDASVPTTFLIDRSGIVREVVSSSMTAEQLEEKVRGYLAK